MLVLLIILVVTNLVTLGAVLYLRFRPAEDVVDDPAVEQAFAAAPQPGTQSANRVRQLISIEILNPIELAGARGRVLGIAGSFAPGFTRRLVYDQTAKTLRQELAQRSVVADVHVHTLRPVPPSDAAHSEVADTADGTRLPLDVEPVSYVDEVDVPVNDLPRTQPPV